MPVIGCKSTNPEVESGGDVGARFDCAENQNSNLDAFGTGKLVCMMLVIPLGQFRHSPHHFEIELEHDCEACDACDHEA